MQQTQGMRQFHWLKRNIRTDTPQSLLFVDTESDVMELIGTKRKCLEHKLRLWTAHYCRLEKDKVTREKEYRGITTKAFWDLVIGNESEDKQLTDKNRVLWIFAHNVAYDFTMLEMWKQFDNGRLTFRTSDADEGKEWNGSACIAGPPTMIKCRVSKNKHTIQVIDTLNYWKCPLSVIGDSVGLPKMQMPEFDASDREWFEYCSNDALIIKTAILKLMLIIRHEDLGHFATTAAGQAWNAYRHRWMKEKFILINGNKESLELERDSYFGGSVKSYFIGKVTPKPIDHSQQEQLPFPQHYIQCDSVYVLDIQSFWPSIMRREYLPRCIVGECVNPTIKELQSALDVHSVVAKVFIQSDTIDFPLKMENYSVMTRGQFWTTLTSPELKLALDNNAIVEINRMYIYKQAVLFRDYVDYFWDKRLTAKGNGDIATEELSKMFLNSLLGKFGQRAIRWKECPEIISGIPWGEWSEWSCVTNKRENYRSLAWLCQMKFTDGESENSFPAIPAHVTAYGRVLMREYERIAGEKNCLYSDTDSLHVNEAGLNALVTYGMVLPDCIGKFVIKRVAKSADYYGPKSYKLDDELTVAGLSKRADKITSDTYEQACYPSLTQLFSDYNHLAMIVPHERKTIRYSEMTGRIDSNGRVKPLWTRQQR